MNNSTLLQQNEGPINSPGFLAFFILLAVVTVVAGLMIGFTIVALFKANAVPTPVHLCLINLLFAGLIAALTVMFTLITSAVFDLVSSTHPRSRHLCRVYLWLFATGAVTRLWSLATFSLSTLAIVIKWIAAIIVLTLWLVPMLLSLYIMLPYAFEVQFECFQAGTCVICEKSLEYVMTCMHVEKETIAIVLKVQDLCSIAEF